LEGFKGNSIQSDDYSVYRPVAKALNLVQLGCWAHERRKFIEAYVSGNLGKALTYAKNQWDTLNIYCTGGALSIDNNIVERSIPPATLGRKNYLFAGSENGAEWIAGFYSLIETCKLHRVEPGWYLTEVLRHIVDYEGTELETLLPEVFALKYSK
jgi:transposase